MSPAPLQRSPLPLGLTPEQAAPLYEAGAGEAAPKDASTYVVLGRQVEQPTPEIVKAFADGLGLDTFGARQRLLLPAPRILRREQSRPAAERWLSWLRSLGLASFMIEPVDWAALKPAMARQATLEPEGFGFVLQDGAVLRATLDDILGFVWGEISSTTKVESSGGNPFLQGYKFDHGTVAARRALQLDVWLRAGGSRALRFVQDTAEPILPNGERVDGSAVFMHRLASCLEVACPHAQRWHEFAAAAGALGSSWELLDQHTRAELQWISSLDGPVRLTTTRVLGQSDAGAFDLYSFLSAMQALRG